MRRTSLTYVYCTVGWVDFALFLEFHEKSWVCGSPRELPNIFDFGSKKSKGQKVKKCKFFLEKCVL